MKPFLNLLLVLLLSPSTSLFHASDETPQDRSAAIDALFSIFDREDAPGASVMVIQGGQVLFKKAYGSANLEDKIKSATTTNYRIASVSKQFTAMAVMILAEPSRTTPSGIRACILRSLLELKRSGKRSPRERLLIKTQDMGLDG